MGSQFTDSFNRLISLKIPVDPPYLKQPETPENDLRLPYKDYYTAKDICKVLRIKPDTFRDRLSKGHYPEPKARVGGKRRFTETEIREMAKITKTLIHKGIFLTGKD